jgi:hypothetical protein
MEAYCNAVRTLKDKFYGIELNHILRTYNEEADKLAKVASERITIPPKIFVRDLAKPSVDFSKLAPDTEKSSEAPLRTIGAEPVDEDPSNEEYEAPSSRDTGHMKTRP